MNRILSLHVLTEPANGNLAFQRDGSFNYRANPGFKGTDTFTYITSDPWDDAVSSESLISRGAMWKYRDDPASPNPDWYTTEFEDSAWKQGLAELGYGDNDENGFSLWQRFT